MQHIRAPRGRGTTRRLAAAVVAVVTLIAGCGASGAAQRPAPHPAPPPSVTRTAPAIHQLARSVPTHLSVPKIDAESSLVSLGLNGDGSVQVPPVSEPKQAGWYDKSPTPGQLGPSVILGHVDGDGQEGIFFELKKMAPGDKIVITRKDGSTVRFKVTKVDEVSKKHFPTEAVYGNTTTPQLRLITCGGSFNPSAHSYVDNIIVYAAMT